MRASEMSVLDLKEERIRTIDALVLQLEASEARIQAQIAQLMAERNRLDRHVKELRS